MYLIAYCSLLITTSYHIRTPAYQPSSLHCQLTSSPASRPSLPFLLPVVRCSPSTPLERLMDAKYIQWTGDDMTLVRKGKELDEKTQACYFFTIELFIYT